MESPWKRSDIKIELMIRMVRSSFGVLSNARQENVRSVGIRSASTMARAPLSHHRLRRICRLKGRGSFNKALSGVIVKNTLHRLAMRTTRAMTPTIIQVVSDGRPIVSIIIPIRRKTSELQTNAKNHRNFSI